MSPQVKLRFRQLSRRTERRVMLQPALIFLCATCVLGQSSWQDAADATTGATGGLGATAPGIQPQGTGISFFSDSLSCHGSTESPSGSAYPYPGYSPVASGYCDENSNRPKSFTCNGDVGRINFHAYRREGADTRWCAIVPTAPCASGGLTPVTGHRPPPAACHRAIMAHACVLRAPDAAPSPSRVSAPHTFR